MDELDEMKTNKYANMEDLTPDEKTYYEKIYQKTKMMAMVKGDAEASMAVEEEHYDPDEVKRFYENVIKTHPEQDMKDIAAHELPILVPDSGSLSGVSPTGPTASTGVICSLDRTVCLSSMPSRRESLPVLPCWWIDVT